MKNRLVFSITLMSLVLPGFSPITEGQQAVIGKPPKPVGAGPQSTKAVPTPTPTKPQIVKPAPTPTPPKSITIERLGVKPVPTTTGSKPAATIPPNTKPAPTPTPQNQKPKSSVFDLISQGKTLYRSAKYKPALAKFEEALKQEPENDEALGLAAVTAYRLDNQSQSRDYFLRRAGLPKQKDSVKSYCYYRAALSHWRQVHDIVVKYCEMKENRYVAELPGRFELDVKYGIEKGLDYADNAIKITKNFTEAYNVKNLLHSEAALIAPDGAKAKEHYQKAAQALHRAMGLFKSANFGTTKETADFGSPTVRIAEYPAEKEGDAKVEDSMSKLIQGGKPLKRVNPPFPNIRLPKPDSSSPTVTSISSEGSDSAVAPGRGSVPASTMPKVKVEVLVSTNGSVVFSRVVDGRSDLRAVALLAARSWKFEPAKFEGKPIQVSGVIAFSVRPSGAR